LHNYSLLLKSAGRNREAIGCLQEAAEIATASGTPALQCHMFSTLSFIMCSIGRLADAENLCNEAHDRANLSGRSFYRGYALEVEAAIEWTKGNRANADRMLESAIAILGRDDNIMMAIVLLRKADFACETGDFDCALETLTRAEPLTPTMGLQNQVKLFRLRIQALAKLGRIAEARQLLDGCELFSTARRIPYQNAGLEQTAAVVTLAEQKYDEAITHLGRTLEFLEKAELKRDIASTCRLLGIAFQGIGKTTQSGEFFERARQIFLGFGDVTSAAELPT